MASWLSGVILSCLRMFATAKLLASLLVLFISVITATLFLVITLICVGEMMQHYNWRSVKLLSVIEVEASEKPSTPSADRRFGDWFNFK